VTRFVGVRNLSLARRGRVCGPIHGGGLWWSRPEDKVVYVGAVRRWDRVSWSRALVANHRILTSHFRPTRLCRAAEFKRYVADKTYLMRLKNDRSFRLIDIIATMKSSAWGTEYEHGNSSLVPTGR